MSPTLIGADVGGTKTAVAVGDGERILGRVEGPGAAIRPGRTLVSASTIADLVRQALAAAQRIRGDVLVVGAAGAGRESERSELHQALRGEGLATRVSVTTDIEIALVAAFGDEPGIVVSAGTGSIAVARDRSGQMHRAGGYGWQIGDEGSGYAIGRAGLNAVTRAVDGRGPRTKLSERLPLSARCADFDALVRWAAAANAAEVAALAPSVLEVAAAGDAVAREIIATAAGELALLVSTLLSRVAKGEKVSVAASGSLLAPDQMLFQTMKAQLADEKRVRVSDAPIDPVLGALRKAQATLSAQ